MVLKFPPEHKDNIPSPDPTKISPVFKTLRVFTPCNNKKKHLRCEMTFYTKGLLKSFVRTFDRLRTHVLWTV